VRARNNVNAHPMLRHFAEALYGYRSGTTKYVKLLDGGLVDNFGLSGFTISRLSASHPFEPLAPDQAVRLRRLMIVIVDAGRAPSGDWVQTVEGPTGTELIMAAADTAVAASVNAGFTAFERSMVEWQRELVAWRCGLTSDQRAKYGAGPNWNCRDIKFYVNRVAFDQLGAERAKLLNAVDTRFKLPTDQVDMVIEAGRDALRVNPGFRAFLNSVGGRPRPLLPRQPPAESVPVAEVPAVTPSAFSPAPTAFAPIR
jgi:NTE family protein